MNELLPCDLSGMNEPRQNNLIFISNSITNGYSISKIPLYDTDTVIGLEQLDNLLG